MVKNLPKNKMNQEDIDNWKKLCKYVEQDVLGYDENQKLSRSQCLRLRGLLNGKYIANNNIESTANYSYEIILLTFKFCMPDIKRSLNAVNFRDETHKFNYILRIVEDNINTVYLKMKKLKKAKEESIKHDVSESVSYENTFKPKEIKKSTGKFDDLW